MDLVSLHPGNLVTPIQARPREYIYGDGYSMPLSVTSGISEDI